MTRESISNIEVEEDPGETVEEESGYKLTAKVRAKAAELEDKLPLVPFHIGVGASMKRVLRPALLLDIVKVPMSTDPEYPAKPSPSVIINTVGERLGVEAEDILGETKDREVTLARQIAMYLVRQHTDLNLKRMGHAFGRDYTTVVYATKKITALLETDERLAAIVGEIQKTIEETVSLEAASKSMERAIVVTRLGLFDCLVHKLTPEEKRRNKGEPVDFVLLINHGQIPSRKLMKEHGRAALEKLKEYEKSLAQVGTGTS